VRKLVIDVQVGLIAIAVALVIGVLVAKSSIVETKRTRDTISVTGSAKKPINADLVTWHLVVAQEDRNATRAARRLGPQVQQVRAFLRRGGLDEEQIELPPFHSETYVRKLSKKRSIRIVEVTQPIEITSRDIDTVEALGRDIGGLVRHGVNVLPEPIAYISTRLAQARIDTLDRATADARHRAQTIVEGLGGKLGRLRRAELGVYQVTPRFSTDVSDYGINDTSSREKDVTAVVSVTFEVKR
jgi:hypothetical protein